MTAAAAAARRKKHAPGSLRRRLHNSLFPWCIVARADKKRADCERRNAYAAAMQSDSPVRDGGQADD